jgi:phage tail sheath protein FI
MNDYLSPGVYVNEVPDGNRSIKGVGTSVGGFVGLAAKGDPDKPELISSWTQFVNKFGSFIPNSYLAYAVYGFFAEGGTACHVVRVKMDPDEKAASLTLPVGSEPENAVLKITARSAGAWGNDIKISMAMAAKAGKIRKERIVSAERFRMTVSYRGGTQVYDNCSLDTVKDIVNTGPGYIEVEILLKGTGVGNAASDIPLTGGAGKIDEGRTDFLGTADSKKGLHALDAVEGVNIVALPDMVLFPDPASVRSGVISALNYCKERGDCFFIADPPPDQSVDAVVDFVTSGSRFNSSYGALYYPWVRIADPLTGGDKAVPPSGVVAGVYARTDSQRGVHKVPAGVSAGHLDSVTGVERIVTDGEQDTLNSAAVNAIRALPGGICLWGARTLSADPEFKYVNVRRLLLFIENSIKKGCRWVAFEPNTPALWGAVTGAVTDFLTRVWRDGALFGSLPREAFFVKVDAENNPEQVRRAGQLIIEVGVAPLKPAEFIIIRISQKLND